jgi:FAD/FMN-containing dehydrogenase
MGNCLTVAIGDHAIVGGLGSWSPLYGLAMGRVVEMELVEGRGQLVIASNDENTALFWTLRGSGPGYLGIVTKIKASLFEASKTNLSLIRIHYPVAQFANAYMKYQELLQ